ncbi:hypothetical protein HAX54_013508, partial [Datura stramonium]|nr:hypothetical protein [Datura stramonium]
MKESLVSNSVPPNKQLHYSLGNMTGRSLTCCHCSSSLPPTLHDRDGSLNNPSSELT